MGNPATKGKATYRDALNVFVYCLFGLSVSLVLVAVMLPPQTLAWLRSDYGLFGRPLNWLETVSPTVDLTHVLLFCASTFLLACLRRRSRAWTIALPMILLAVASELLQYWVPGRHPLMSDLDDDLLGVLSGWMLAMPARWAGRRVPPAQELA